MQIDQIRKELIEERRELLVSYCALVGIEVGHPEVALEDRLEEFCEVLVDYAGLIHFELLDNLSDEVEARQAVQEIYSGIVETTSMIVDFNDRYEGRLDAGKLKTFVKDLSRLGEALAERFDLEDKVLLAVT